ncbi:MAG: hypothetical protein AB7N80_04580 [Bdellovibrionales bacterium]
MALAANSWKTASDALLAHQHKLVRANDRHNDVGIRLVRTLK